MAKALKLPVAAAAGLGWFWLQQRNAVSPTTRSGFGIATGWMPPVGVFCLLSSLVNAQKSLHLSYPYSNVE